MEEKLQKILNDPDALGAVMSMAKSLSSGTSESEETPETSKTEDGGAGSDGLFGLLEGVDPEMLSKLMGLFGEYTRKDDRRTELLIALKPYLRGERAAKLDRAGQIVRLARTANKAFDMFNG
jgi:hypothetical protein